MRAVLSAEIPVRRFAVFAEMAWLELRPELGLVCRAARDADRRLTPQLVQAVLPGLSMTGATNVRHWCQTLGLCDARGGLTAIGEDTAQTDEAPVPEQGVYSFSLACHPVIGKRLLAVERLVSHRDPRYETLHTLEPELEPDRGVPFRSVLDLGERFLLRALPSNHGQVAVLPQDTDATCSIRWTLDFEAEHDQWRLEGWIEASRGREPVQHEPEHDGLDLWALAASWGRGPLARAGRWDPDRRRLAVSFGGLDPEEQDRFMKTMRMPRLEVPGKGSYCNVTIEDVPIEPATAEGAQHWAMARLERRLEHEPRYRSRSELRSLFVELCDGTPLERHAPLLPAHDHHVDDDLYVRSREVFWSLAAPVDLCLHPPTAGELGELRIGGAMPERARPPAGGIIHVPYRGGWSMRRIVERLLEGVEPHRLLLVDRYVRGSDNLATLRIFVEAIRGIGPSAPIDVWTGDEDDADLAAVRHITGSAPRSYREVFGPVAPHDRYVLVVPSTGDGFGWQLSNSPLHARTDVEGASPETPLRWRDLVGTRLPADGLAPELQRWLGGAR